MTRLQAKLGQRIPERLAVGRGTALFLGGTCSAGAEAIEALSIVANGAEFEVLAHGMPALDTNDRSGNRWWGLVPIPGGTGDSTLRLGLRATLSRRSEATAELGEVELVGHPVNAAEAAHGNGG